MDNNKVHVVIHVITFVKYHGLIYYVWGYDREGIYVPEFLCIIESSLFPLGLNYKNKSI